MRNLVIGLVVVMMCVGCAEKEDRIDAIQESINSIHNDHIQKLWPAITELRTKIETGENIHKWSEDCRFNIYSRLDELEQQRPYDPNAPELQYILVTDPNWARDYGDTRDTRVLMNVSANRGMALQNRNVLAEISKRFLALEALHIDPNGAIDPNDPNEVKK